VKLRKKILIKKAVDVIMTTNSKRNKQKDKDTETDKQTDS